MPAILSHTIISLLRSLTTRLCYWADQLRPQVRNNRGGERKKCHPNSSTKRIFISLKICKYAWWNRKVKSRFCFLLSFKYWTLALFLLGSLHPSPFPKLYQGSYMLEGAGTHHPFFLGPHPLAVAMHYAKNLCLHQKDYLRIKIWAHSFTWFEQNT